MPPPLNLCSKPLSLQGEGLAPHLSPREPPPGLQTPGAIGAGPARPRRPSRDRNRERERAPNPNPIANPISIAIPTDAAFPALWARRRSARGRRRLVNGRFAPFSLSMSKHQCFKLSHYQTMPNHSGSLQSSDHPYRFRGKCSVIRITGLPSMAMR